MERDVEHFRPKGPVVKESHPGYWWLAYDWDNLLIACKVNNTVHKANNFPLLNGGIRAKNEHHKLEDERPVLINPALEDPSKYITFHWEEIGGRYFCMPIATAEDIDNRGRDTIEIVGIDRRELMDESERAECGKLLKDLAVRAAATRFRLEDPNLSAPQQKRCEKLFSKLKEDIKRATAPEKTYACARRAFFAKYDLADCNYYGE